MKIAIGFIVQAIGWTMIWSQLSISLFSAGGLMVFIGGILIAAGGSVFLK